MNILVIGGGGMVGVKLINRLAADGRLGSRDITKIIRHDVVLAPPPPASSFPIETLIGDLSVPGEAEKLVALRPDVIFHLAAIVSGEAEADFEKGYRINLDGTRYLFEAVRKAGGGYKPKLIFTSSIAVFGAPFPEAIPDDFFTTPLTSYGTQKAIGELLLSDYSRRGFLDGVGLRFPTICVRPGKPNLAASGFFSNIIRERLKFRGTLAALTAEPKLSARVLAAMPFVMFAIIYSLNGEYMKPLFTQPIGQFLVVYAVVSVAIGYFIMTRIADVDL